LAAENWHIVTVCFSAP